MEAGEEATEIAKEIVQETLEWKFVLGTEWEMGHSKREIGRELI
jgi:hypothetical protein